MTLSDKTVAEKLMLKEGRTVLFVNPPKGYKSLLGELPKGVKVLKSPTQPADMIQVFVADRQELEEQLPKMKAALAPKGMLWVTYHKGTSKVKTDIHRDTINAYAASIGLQGVALISIDDDWSALRLKSV
jgi:predicted CoA-binding protein